jgi:cytochrome P450
MTKLKEFRAAESQSRFAASRLLFKWLSDDKERGDLYRCLLDSGEPLMFQSRADAKLPPTAPGESVFHQDVYLLTKRSHIEEAFKNSGDFSNAPYQALGSGTFMLGLDGGDHKNQREFAEAYLAVNKRETAALSVVAFKAAAVLPLKLRKFDVADLAEQAALRYVGFLFGYAQADHPVLEATMRMAYRGLNYQIIGRHFVSEPGAIQEAAAGMGALLKRTAYLIDLYREQAGRAQQDEYKTIGDELRELQQWKDQRGDRPLESFVPVLRNIAAQKKYAAKYSGAELAVIVVGLIAGTVGNVQASTAIAISQFFSSQKTWDEALEAARKSWQQDADYGANAELQAMIWEALRLNPPAAFLPRKTTKKLTLGTVDIPKESVVMLAVGGATRDTADEPDKFKPARNVQDEFIFGGPGKSGFVHQCVGKYLAMPLVTHIARQVIRLPGLAQSLDPRTAEPYGLEKLWGIICQSYPLEYTRDQLLTQSPLIVVMNVRTPVSLHAEELRKVIRYGAPRIEKRLRDSEHVHFAQFLFIEDDTKLVLFTIYDRDFDSYIEHFALKIGPLFDRIFEHIQNPPPRPVDEFPKEFVDAIRRHNARPAGDYFFSAYPKTDVSMITNQFPPEGG